MQSARDELRVFAGERRRLGAELGLAAAACGSLFALAPLMDAARPDVQVFYFLAWCFASIALTALVPRVVETLKFRCPRCAHRFHAGRERGLSVRTIFTRACAHCSLPLPRHPRA